MTSGAGTLEHLARIVGEALRPLEQRLADGAAEALFNDLGLRLPEGFIDQGILAGALSSTISAAAQLAPALAGFANAIESSDPARIIAAGNTLLQRIADTLRGAAQIASGLDQVAQGFPGLSPVQRAHIQALASDLPSRLVNLLLVEWIEAKAPALVPALGVTGLLDDLPEDGDPADSTAPPFTRRALRLDQIGSLLSNPLQYLKMSFGWGRNDFNGRELFRRIGAYASQAGLPVTILTPPSQPAILEAGLFRLAVDPGKTPPGLVLRLRVPATTDFSERIQLLSPWALVVNITGRFEAGLDATIQTNGTVSLIPPTGTASLSLRSSLEAGDGKTPFTLLGQTGASRVEATSIKFALSFIATWNSSTRKATGDPLVQAEITNGKVVIDTSQGDGFLTHLTSGLNLRASFDLRVIWSPSTGARFEGGSGLEIVIPAHFSIGSIAMRRIHLLFTTAASGNISLEISAEIRAKLGPLDVTIDQVGVEMLISFPERVGNLGPANLDTKFKPPAGIGLSVDTVAITGGGFLSFDNLNGRYSGALQLKIHDITVTAFGLLDTKLPSGESGFSFLILISTEFNPPIQLGLGFKLSKVGGLAGINRAVDENVLQKGLRNRTLDHILFAKDPLRNAPQIISDLRAVFPAAEGSFVFGPIAAITWGTPTLIEAEVGVVLQISNSIRLFLLGQINALIPPAVPGPPQKPIIELHLDIVGFIDFNQKRLEIDAVLRDSRVVGFPLFGDAALRLNWGDEPLLIFSIGGLHPQFTPPSNFPKLRRLTVLLGTGNSPRITLELYLAVTSNTFQVGARAEMQVGGKYNLHGWLSFDALFIFSPFSFTAEITAGLDLRRNKKVLAGVHLNITLSGPSPWRAKGEACISLLFFDVCVDFDETFGESIEFIPPVADPTDELLKAISDVGNWSASLPVAVERVVTTAASKINAPTVLVDPMGAVALHQRELPFNLSISKVGEARLEKPGPYVVPSVKVGGQVYGKPDSPGEGKKYSLVKDSFAPGQFVDLTEAEKLSRPSFEKLDAGVAVASDALKMGKAIEAEVVYETKIIDSPFDGPPPLYRLIGAHLLSMNDRGAAALGAFNTTGARRFAPDLRSPAFVGLTDDAFVIVSADDLSRRTDISDSPSAKGAAHIALADYLAAHPQERGQLQVVPLREL